MDHALSADTNQPPTVSVSTDTSRDIDDTMKTLESFASELPDYDRELSRQDLRATPDMFTCFPRLPVELRLKIWEFTLPGRRLVRLYPAPEDSPAWSKWRNCPLPQDVALLPALYACSESREVAIRHTGLFSQRVLAPWMEHNEPKERIFAFRPNLDYFHIKYDDGFLCPHGFFSTTVLSPQGEDPFSFITKLEIGNLSIAMEAGIWLCWTRYTLLSHQDFGDTGSGRDMEYTGVGGALAPFHNLQQLHLVFAKTVDRDELLQSPWILFDLERTLAGIFHHQQDKYPHFCVPQVSFHSYRRRQCRSDDQLRTDKRLPCLQIAGDAEESTIEREIGRILSLMRR